MNASPDARRALEQELAEREAEAQARLSKFSPSDFYARNTAIIAGINQRQARLKRVRLERFIINVEDADTLVLRKPGFFSAVRSAFGYGDIQVRLAGIDAPEVGGHGFDPLAPVRIWQEQPGGEEASQALRSLIEQQQDNLTLAVSTGRRTYGRYLGALGGAEGANLNLELLRQGAATALPFGKTKEDIVSRTETLEAERDARIEGLGLWQYKRYQAQAVVNERASRRITHNILTRMDRLSSNQALGSYASWLASLGEQRGPLTFSELMMANTFSGFDDQFNTIEGLGHKGIAHRLRRQTTDFGSGFMTELFGGMAGFLRASRKEVTRGIAKWKRHTGIKTELISGPDTGMSFNRGEMRLFWGTRDQEAIQAAKIPFADIPKLKLDIFAHEMSEGFYGGRVRIAAELARREAREDFGKRMLAIREKYRRGVLQDPSNKESLQRTRDESISILKRTATETADEVIRGKGFGSHFSPGVIGDEILFAAKMGPRHYRAMRQFRLTELARLEGQEFVLDEMAHYISTTRRIYSSFEKKWLPKFEGFEGIERFSGFDDWYNTIEGLGHKGVAHRFRRQTTDFGSGWIGAAIAKGVGALGKAVAVAGDPLLEGLSNIRQLFSGRSLLFHGTSVKAAQSIIEEGLLGSKAGRAGSITRAVIASNSKLTKESIASTVYLTRSRATAGIFARQQAYLDRGVAAQEAQLRALNFLDPQGQVVGFDIPLWKPEFRSMQILNPEAAIYKDAEGYVRHVRERREAILKPLGLHPHLIKALDILQTRATRSAYSIYEKSITFRGSVFPERIIKSKSFIPLREPEWEEYANEHLIGTIPSESIGYIRKILFSGFDDAYNVITGLPEGGTAAPIRKKLSDFGSGWDPLRAIARQFLRLGKRRELTEKMYQGFLRSKPFQKALDRAGTIRSLGEGSYGETYLMEGKITLPRRGILGLLGFKKDSSFQFVHKRLHPGPQSRASMLQELWAMRRLQGHPNVPTLYSAKRRYGHSLYMEYIPGEDAVNTLYGGAHFSRGQIAELEQGLRAAHWRGVGHGDIWQRQRVWTREVERNTPLAAGEELLPTNVMITPEGRVAIIDWGFSGPSGGIPASQSIEHAAASLGVGRQLSRSQFDLMLTASLRAQEGTISPLVQPRMLPASLGNGLAPASAAPPPQAPVLPVRQQPLSNPAFLLRGPAARNVEAQQALIWRRANGLERGHTKFAGVKNLMNSLPVSHAQDIMDTLGRPPRNAVQNLKYRPEF